MDELLADFIAETREMMEASSGEIVAWEANPSDRARLDTIFRFVHTVKGNCGFFDFPRLERLSHAAEDALAEVRAGRRDADTALVSAVLAIIDRIGEMTDAVEAGEELGDGCDDELIAALASDVSTSTPAAEEAEQPSPTPAPVPEELREEGTDAAGRNRAAPAQRSIRLPVDLLDELMKGVSDMVLARNDLARRLREAGEQPHIDAPFERLSGIHGSVREAVTRMRMQRLEHLFTSLPRLVRDLSNELGKQVMVDFEGGDVELDREMIEMVRDPLTHIIRNAIDHGIESPVQRLQAGKREIGMLRFSARQAGNRISLAISDDGGGVDTDKLCARAVSAGLHSEAELEQMSEQGKLRLLFQPGISTADEVSAVSGRGVGMDVVRANIEKVGGSIDIQSRPGQGTTFELNLPLTLSIIAALTVESAGQRYAIPRSYVEEIVFGNARSIEFARIGNRRLVTFRGRRVACLSLEEALGISDGRDTDWNEMTLVLVRMPAGDIVALGVERVHDHEDVVVKPIAPAVMATKLYTGTTLLDDGRPMMLLDMPSIVQLRGLVDEGRAACETIDTEGDGDDAEPGIAAMLFTGLDKRRRAFRLELVRRIDTIDASALDIQGDNAQVVLDGKIVPLTGHEHGPLPQGRCRLLRLSDSESELAYIVADVQDAIDIDPALAPAAENTDFEGIALVGGQPVPLVDGHALFARHGSKPAAQAEMTCTLPPNSEWSSTILRPLVIAAGYRPVDEGGDVAIILADEGQPTDDSQCHIIRLRAQRDAPQDSSDTIYRYDRAALLAALDQVRIGRAG